MPDISWDTPGKLCAEFFTDQNFVTGIRGPVGSGKSVACCVKLMLVAAQQEPNKKGVRRTRFAIVRNTNPQLKTTTIKTWLEWFPEEEYGKFNWSVPYTHNIKVGDIDCEVIFLSLDRPEDVRKLLSLDLTAVWVNEAREVHKEIIDGCTMRVGRFPSMKDGGPTWYGVMLDTNAPDDDHWWPIMAGDVPIPEHLTEEEALMLVKPDNWSFYNQPPGMLEVRDETNKLVGYRVNELAENIDNLPRSYYDNMVRGKRKNWIDVYVRNQIGAVFQGKPVYERSFSKDFHCSDAPLVFDPTCPIRIGIDFGRTPAAVILQKTSDSQWQMLRELCARGMGAKRFAGILRQLLTHIAVNAGCTFSDLDIVAWGDPRGDDATQSDDNTPILMIQTHAKIPCFPAPSNDPVLRIEAVENVLDRSERGNPGLLIDPSCSVIKRGFENGYHYKMVARAGEGARFEPNPEKNRYSHPHDALQYVLLGEGEGAEVLIGKNIRNVTPINARQSSKGLREMSKHRRARRGL